MFDNDACYRGGLYGTGFTVCVGKNVLLPCRKFVAEVDGGEKQQHRHLDYR